MYHTIYGIVSNVKPIDPNTNTKSDVTVSRRVNKFFLNLIKLPMYN